MRSFSACLIGSWVSSPRPFSWPRIWPGVSSNATNQIGCGKGFCGSPVRTKSMNRYKRRVLLGVFAGGLASVALIYVVPHPLADVLMAAFVGAAFSVSMSPARDAYIDNMMTAAALGVPLW